MRMSATWRRSAALLVAAVAAAGLVTVPAAGPAAATPRICSEILTAGPGSAAGTVFVTFTEARAPYTVMAFDTELVRMGKLDPVASTEGTPSGTILGGLQPATEYWIYVESESVTRGVAPCLSDGVKAMSGAVSGTDVWMQSYGRLHQTDPCDSGWWASYGQWMHAGLGGWTCDRYVPKYG